MCHFVSSYEQPVADLHVRPVAVERVRLVEDELGRIVDAMIAAPTTRQWRRTVLVLAKQPLDLGADLGFGRRAVRPIDGEVGTMLSTSSSVISASADRPLVLDAAGESVVEGSFLLAEAKLLVSASRVAEALGDFD